MSGSSFTDDMQLNALRMMCIIRKATILLSQIENIPQNVAELCSVVCISPLRSVINRLWLALSESAESLAMSESAETASAVRISGEPS